MLTTVTRAGAPDLSRTMTQFTGRQTILVVEDDPTVSQFVRLIPVVAPGGVGLRPMAEECWRWLSKV